MSPADVSLARGEKDKSHNCSGEMNSLVGLWPATLAFLILSSVLFAWFFEWERYHIITAYKLHGLSILDKALLFLAARCQILGLVRAIAPDLGSFDRIRTNADRSYSSSIASG